MGGRCHVCAPCARSSPATHGLSAGPPQPGGVSLVALGEITVERCRWPAGCARLSAAEGPEQGASELHLRMKKPVPSRDGWYAVNYATLCAAWNDQPGGSACRRCLSRAGCQQGRHLRVVRDPLCEVAVDHASEFHVRLDSFGSGKPAACRLLLAGALTG